MANRPIEGEQLMQKLIMLILLAIAIPATANNLSRETKTELRQLYYDINATEEPSQNKKIKQKISNLVNKSCFESAQKKLHRKTKLAAWQKKHIQKMIQNTCSCVANSNEMIKGVIQSAVLFKANGKHSVEAKNAMRKGMQQAQQHCMQARKQ